MGTVLPLVHRTGLVSSKAEVFCQSCGPEYRASQGEGCSLGLVGRLMVGLWLEGGWAVSYIGSLEACLPCSSLSCRPENGDQGRGINGYL